MELIDVIIENTWAVWPAVIAAGAALGGSVMNKAGAKKRERRQMGLQVEGQKEMAEFNRQQQMKLWEDTNYDAQRKQMEKAGLNVGLMYEGGGQGGVTQAQAGNVDAPKGQEEDSIMESVGMGIDGIMRAAQIKNIEAQTKKTETETQNIAEGGVNWANTTEDARGKKFFNDLNERFKQIEADERWQKAEAGYWEQMEKGAKHQTKYSELYTENPAGKTKGASMIRMEFEKLEQDLIEAKKTNNILDAEQKIKEFEAKLAESGIPPNSPWYAKLLGDLLEKIGIMDWMNIGKSEAKKQIRPK